MSEKVTPADCTVFREKAREEGVSISDNGSMFDQSWRKVHRHVAGDCDHEISKKPVNDSKALERFPVSASDCGKLRSKARQADSLLDLRTSFGITKLYYVTFVEDVITMRFQ